MSEKNILANPGGSNSASFESETHDPQYQGVSCEDPPQGPPREPKLVKRVISSSFCYCHFKDDLRIRSHREKFNIDILAQNFFRSQYTCGEARKKIWDKKSMLNFSRQAYNEKVTDCHALFRILRFFELGCFLGRNIDLGGSFPTHDLKFGQFCNSTKNFGHPKFCWNFSEIFRFFFQQF